MRRRLVLALLCPTVVLGSEFTELASSGDPDDPFDFNLSVGYERRARKAAIKRELTGVVNGKGLARPIIVKDLAYAQVVHTLPIRAQIGIWRDLQLSVTIPLVVSDRRELGFAQDGDCNYVGDTSGLDLPSCVDARNSTAVRDGLLPGISRESTDYWGDEGNSTVASPDIDADGPGLLFPKRSGLDQLHIGLDYAILSQARDDTKPTWTVGFESRIAVGDAMDYDPARPEDQTGVGRGVHEFVWHTSFSKATEYLEPFLRIWYALPVAKNGSLYRDHGGGQDRVGPQHHAGANFGMEVFVLNRPEQQQKVGVELGAHIEGAFEGRGYSEIWEMFRNNAQLDGPCGIDGNSDGDLSLGEQWASCDLRPGDDPDGDGPMPEDADGLIRHPGITSIENYASFGGRLAIRTEVGRFVKFRIGAGLSHDLEHYITFSDAGEDGGDDDLVVTPSDSTEINPVYRPIIDQIGRRYRVEETTVFDFFVNATVLF